MKVLFFGTPDIAAVSLEKLICDGFEIIGVVTQPDKPKGRGKAMQFTAVKEVAVRAEIPVLQPKKVREPEVVEEIRQFHPDVIVVVAFGQLIPKAILDMPQYGCVNVHASLLPKYRGAAPIQWAVIDGEEKSGVTTMQMDEGLDTGDMLLTEEVVLDSQETGGSLFDKLSEVGAGLLLKTLDELEAGNVHPQKQPKESTTAYAAMLTKKMGEIDWTKSAVQIERLVRGLNPWPSAYTHLGQKTLKIWRAVVYPLSEQKKEPGTVILMDKKHFGVQTGDGMLEILELQLEGKKRMDADAFLRGYQLENGTKLGEE